MQNIINKVRKVWDPLIDSPEKKSIIRKNYIKTLITLSLYYLFYILMTGILYKLESIYETPVFGLVFIIMVLVFIVLNYIAIAKIYKLIDFWGENRNLNVKTRILVGYIFSIAIIPLLFRLIVRELSEVKPSLDILTDITLSISLYYSLFFLTIIFIYIWGLMGILDSIKSFFLGKYIENNDEIYKYVGYDQVNQDVDEKVYYFEKYLNFKNVREAVKNLGYGRGVAIVISLVMFVVVLALLIFKVLTNFSDKKILLFILALVIAIVFTIVVFFICDSRLTNISKKSKNRKEDLEFTKFDNMVVTKNPKAKEALEPYKIPYKLKVKIEKFSRPVLLNGQYGSGKSYFVDNELSKMYTIKKIQIYESGYKDNLFYYVFKCLNKKRYIFSSISESIMQIIKNPTLLKYLIISLIIPILIKIFMFEDNVYNIIIGVIVMCIMLWLLPYFIVIEKDFSIYYRDLYFEYIMHSINMEKDLIVFEDIDRLSVETLYELESILYYLQRRKIKVLLLGDIDNLAEKMEYQKMYYEKIFDIYNIKDINSNKKEEYLKNNLPFLSGEIYLKKRLCFEDKDYNSFVLKISEKFVEDDLKKFSPSNEQNSQVSKEDRKKVEEEMKKIIENIIDNGYETHKKIKSYKKNINNMLSEKNRDKIKNEKEIQQKIEEYIRNQIEEYVRNQIKEEKEEYKKFIEKIEKSSFRTIVQFVENEKEFYNEYSLSDSFDKFIENFQSKNDKIDNSTN